MPPPPSVVDPLSLHDALPICQWFAKRKNVIALLRETIFQQESPLVDTDANNKAADADAALQELGGDQVAFGYLTATVTVMDEDRSEEHTSELQSRENLVCRLL